MPSTSIGTRVHLLFLLAIALLACGSAEAAQRVVVSPVQAGRDIVTADLVLEVEEAVRAGIMNEAPDLDLRVMKTCAPPGSPSAAVEGPRSCGAQS